MRCPQCGDGNIETTTKGGVGPVDTNAVTCGCGHKGTAQDWIDIEELENGIQHMEEYINELEGI